MDIKFFSFDYASPDVKSAWKKATETVIDSGVFIGGEVVQRFESEFSRILEIEHCIGVSNGYDGLELALRSLGISNGDKVVVPAHTFIATWNAVLAIGGEPIGIDVGADAQMDISRLYQVLKSQNIKCVITVHMHGSMSDIGAIVEICEKEGIPVIEDSSQAHFARKDGVMAGTKATVGVFSLYPTKNLGAVGDAGVVVTKSLKLANSIRGMANYGAKSGTKYIHELIGFNKRLDTIQAAVLLINLSYIEEWNRVRNFFADKYQEACNSIGLDFISGHVGSVWHHFCVLTENRDQLKRFLELNKIGTEIHYPRVASLEVDSILARPVNRYFRAEELSRTTLSLPLSQFHTEEMIERVINVLKLAKKTQII